MIRDRLYWKIYFNRREWEREYISGKRNAIVTVIVVHHLLTFIVGCPGYECVKSVNKNNVNPNKSGDWSDIALDRRLVFAKSRTSCTEHCNLYIYRHVVELWYKATVMAAVPRSRYCIIIITEIAPCDMLSKSSMSININTIHYCIAWPPLTYGQNNLDERFNIIFYILVGLFE